LNDALHRVTIEPGCAVIDDAARPLIGALGKQTQPPTTEKEFIMSKLLVALLATAFAATVFAADVATPPAKPATAPAAAPVAAPAASAQPQTKAAAPQKTHKKHRHSTANMAKPAPAAADPAAKK
jgi:hypothetical protein